MQGYRNRRLLLFLAILILPTAAISIQGRMIAARDLDIERARSKQRLEDTRKRIAAEVGQEMVSRLERIKGQEVANAAGAIPQPGTYSDPAVVIVGRMNADVLYWPWEVRFTYGPFRLSNQVPMYAEMAEKAMREESSGKDDKRASDLYRALLESAHSDGQRAYARFGLARTLRRSGAQSESIAIYLQLLGTSSEVVDESGVDFASTAASALTEMHTASAEVLSRVSQETRDGMLPMQIDRWRPILEVLQSTGDPEQRENARMALNEVLKRNKDLEDAKSQQGFRDLHQDFPGLPTAPTNWQPYRTKNNELWLVGKTAGRSLVSSSDGRTISIRFPDTSSVNTVLPLVVVVRAETIRAGIESERVVHPDGTTFQINLGGDGEPLGEEHLPGLRLTLPDMEADTTESLSLQRSFYGWSLLFVAPFTFLGGYLLWRDTRREVRIAELRSQFVSNVSHELKTPLTAIRMFAEALQMKYATDPVVHKEYLDTIVNESERLTRLLNNVLDFSRVDRGQKNYQMARESLAEVVRTAAQTMRYPLAEQGFVLGLSVDDQLPPVKIDSDAILQAILNLLTNAMKYSGRSRNIELQLSSENRSAVIRVSDHGIGIPANEQGRIFEKFYRSPIPDNQAIAGTGIGLALVAHIVEAHGGTIKVQSNPGEGSTFSICLPLNGSDDV